MGGNEGKAMLGGQSAEAPVREGLGTIVRTHPSVASVLNIITVHFGDDVMVAVKAQMKDAPSTTVLCERINDAEARIKTVRAIVGGFGADLLMECSAHPSAGPEGIEILRDCGTSGELGQFTEAGSIQTSWHRTCTNDLHVPCS